MGSEEWRQWENSFVGDGVADGSPWITRPISLDMLKQFLMRQVTEAAVAGFGIPPVRKRKVGSEERVFQVMPSARMSFHDLVCDRVAAEEFLALYAPVWKS